jgi:hypothetical protein
MTIVFKTFNPDSECPGVDIDGDGRDHRYVQEAICGGCGKANPRTLKRNLEEVGFKLDESHPSFDVQQGDSPPIAPDITESDIDFEILSSPPPYFKEQANRIAAAGRPKPSSSLVHPLPNRSLPASPLAIHHGRSTVDLLPDLKPKPGYVEQYRQRDITENPTPKGKPYQFGAGITFKVSVEIWFGIHFPEEAPGCRRWRKRDESETSVP